MPNGNLLKQNWPYGVINVVKSLDSLAKGICQKPLLASCLLNIVAPVSWGQLLASDVFHVKHFHQVVLYQHRF